jgi:uncharacterized membrane protein YsdA (DUF1294 family)
MTQSFIYIYLIAINLIAFGAMALDKSKARHNRERIPEAVLMTLAVIGGSVGAIAAMLCCRHKTRHLKFTLGLPAILCLQLLLLWLIVHGGAFWAAAVQSIGNNRF